MKTLWNALSFFCIVQVLAAGMFVAWLWQSKRLTRDRLEAARELFAPPDGESMAMSAADKGTEESADAASARSGSAGSGTGDAARTMRAASRIEEQQRIASQRLRDEHAQLTTQLDQRLADLQRREEQLALDRAAWEKQVAALRLAQDDEQFAKAIKLLSELPAKQAKQQIAELVTAGEIEQAVAYLNAMNARTAGKILREFKDSNEVLVARDLLERLRTFGHEPEMGPDANDADPTDTAAS
ncbi:MAG: hypothetical protein KDA22_01855 [Phycisphaerales bacterium]|nr:hypothetical protein [Phycisphaerales bacterium]